MGITDIDTQLLSEARVLAAYAIFIGSYFVFALGKFPWMKIDRPGAAIIGAILMVAFRIVGADEARDLFASVERCVQRRKAARALPDRLGE